MLTSLEIEGFRCFERLRVPGLTRVNLIVGRNNSGKTSLLEAVETVVDGTVNGLIRGPRRRDETTDIRDDEDSLVVRRPAPYRINIAHVFAGHALTAGTRLRINAISSRRDVSTPLYLACGIEQAMLEERSIADNLADDEDLRLILTVTSDRLQTPTIVEVSPSGGISIRTPLVTPLDGERGMTPVRLVTTDIQGLARLWDDVNLTDRYALVLDALRIVEPRVEQVAFQTSIRITRQGGVRIKLADSKQPLPLGSIGDGSKRLLALALNLANTSHGVLLVDEIDTGLHHSVMTKMWQLVIGTARRLDTQVFATTHSEDCVRALAEAAELDPAAAADVSLHRIDPGETETMRYSADELSVATRGHIEVR